MENKPIFWSLTTMFVMAHSCVPKIFYDDLIILWFNTYYIDVFVSFVCCSKAESTLRVVRAKLDSGERVVGLRYPELLIPLVEKTLKEEGMIRRLMERQYQTQLVS